MEKTEIYGFTMVPNQEHITFPLLNIMMDIVNSNFLLLDSLLQEKNVDPPTEENEDYKNKILEMIHKLKDDMIHINEKLTVLKDMEEKTKVTLQEHTNILEELQKDIDNIDDIYAKKDYTYDTVTIDRIAESVHRVKQTMRKMVHDINHILLSIANQETIPYYSKDEIDEKLKSILNLSAKIEELKEYYIIAETNHKDLFDKMQYILKIIERR